MNNKLEVSKIILGAFVFPSYHRQAFIKALLIPLALIVGLQTGLDKLEEQVSLTYWVMLIGNLIFTTIFCVVCHRLVLIDPDKISSSPIMKFGRREMQFLWWMLSLTFLVITVSGLLITFEFAVIKTMKVRLGQGTVAVMIIAASLPAIYVAARQSINFPAIATDSEQGWKWAWRLTSGNGWRLVLIVAGLPIAIASCLHLFVNEPPTLVVSLLVSILAATLTAIEVGALSLAYKQLREASM